MKLLEEKIRREGVVNEGNILKVDGFLNHQMDVALFREMAKDRGNAVRTVTGKGTDAVRAEPGRV